MCVAIIPHARGAKPPKIDSVEAVYTLIRNDMEGKSSLSGVELVRLLEERLPVLAKSPSADERFDVLTLTCQATAGIVHERVTVALLRGFLHDSDPRIRKEALLSCIGCMGLGRIALPLLPEITKLQADSDPAVSSAARLVTGQLESPPKSSP